MPGLRLTGDGGRSIEIRASHSQQLQHETWNTVVFTYDVRVTSPDSASISMDIQFPSRAVV